MTSHRILYRCLGIGLFIGNAAGAQDPVTDSVPPSPVTAMQGIWWALGAGVASGDKGLAGFVSVGEQRRLLSTELRLSRAEASAPRYPFGSAENDRGPISSLECAGLAGIGKRSRRTLSAIRVGIGIVSKTQCVQNCGFLDPSPPHDETVRTVGLAYGVEAGLLLGTRWTVGLAATLIGNANSAHSFVSGGGRVSIGSWK